MDTAKKRYEQWRACARDKEISAELAAMDGDAREIEERFGGELAFGTGGLRGVLGAGTARMNVYTVRRATQGLADYLLANGELPRSVAIAHDSRIGSERFAREAACVLAANGITAHLYPRLEPTPALSWAVRDLRCGAGVCITASHNPSKYNGYKVYGPDGCQITLEAAEEISARIARVDCFEGARRMPLDEAVAKSLVRYIPEDCLRRFVDAVYAQRVGDGAGVAGLKLVYTPLNGTGLECVKMLLERMGVAHVTVVPEQEHPDGRFPTCPYPNPEIREAMELGLKACEAEHPDLLVGTDPDCDRCGTAVPDGKGGYRLISGNEMGVILLDFICRMRRENGTMPEKPVAVTTIVSNDMVTAVAKKYGVELRRTLTGFKFIGEKIGLLEAGGHAERFIFGFEESYGYLSGAHVRDKDAVNATLLVCEAAAWYAQQGMTLLDALNRLYEEYGCYANGLSSFAFEGVDRMEKMAALMESFRRNPPQKLAGRCVRETVDYAAGVDGLPKANVFELRLEGGGKLIVRPSGTEPKIKFYAFGTGKTEQEAQDECRELQDAAAELARG